MTAGQPTPATHHRPLVSTGGWRELIPPLACVRILIVAALLTVAYWNSITHVLMGRWMRDANWSHGFLIPLFSLYFLYTRRDELRRVRPQPSYWGAVVLAGALVMHLVFLFRFPAAYPRAFSLVPAILGVTLLLGGWNVMRVAWFPIAFLVLAVPLPERTYVALTMPLRQWASAASAALLPVLVPGLHTDAQAVVIDYILPGHPPGTLNVEEACSGMRLMMAFVTLGVAMAYVGRRAHWQRGIMIAACIPIAVFCNTLRVTATGLFFIFGHVESGFLRVIGVDRLEDMARGTPHQFLGLITLLIALGLFALIGFVLDRLFVDEAEEPNENRRPDRPNTNTANGGLA